MDAAGSSPLTMPLHELAAAEGEAGLRRRFALESEACTRTARDQLQRALSLAGLLHQDDRWGDQPYVNHLLRVTIRIMSEYRVGDVDVLCAALLHDTVEDHPARLAGAMELATARRWAVPETPGRPGDPVADTTIALNRLAGWFGTRVADLVEAVTSPPFDPARDRNQQYRDHLMVSLRASPWARVLKASDFTDNAGAIQPGGGPKARRTAEKYRSAAPALRNLVALPDTPLPAGVHQRVLAELDAIAARLDRTLAP